VQNTRYIVIRMRKVLKTDDEIDPKKNSDTDNQHTSINFTVLQANMRIHQCWCDSTEFCKSFFSL
jgi:hypothetical protein